MIPRSEIRFSMPVERIENRIFFPRVENSIFDPLLRHLKSNFDYRYDQKL